MIINRIRSEILHRRHTLLLPILVLAVSCSRETITENQNDNSVPSVPSDVNVYSAHDGAAGIEWTSNNGQNIKGYNIYRQVNKADNLTKYSFTTDAHFIDYPLEYDSVYYYAVTCVNNLGIESALSPVVSAKPVNLYSPDPIYSISINGRNTGDSHYIHLEWTPQQDYDVKGYEIYRSLSSTLEIKPENLIGFSSLPYFNDTSVEILKTYYYEIISVDKGGLKSDYGILVSDIVLNRPALIYPENDSVVKNLGTLQFRTCANAATYRIVIQSNDVYGTVAEYNVYSDLVNQVLTYTFDSNVLTSYRKYYWRVIAYSNSDGEPNSYSTLNSFTYIAE